MKEQCREKDPNDPQQDDSRTSYQGIQGYSNLATTLRKKNAGSIIRAQAMSAGHPMMSFPESDGKFEIKPKKKKATQTRVAARPQGIKVGQTYRHKKRGTRVTIIQAEADVSVSGDPLHLAVESRTGKFLKVLEKNLE